LRSTLKNLVVGVPEDLWRTGHKGVQICPPEAAADRLQKLKSNQFIAGGELSTMYSACCAVDCQEKRVLTWRTLTLKQSWIVKNFAYQSFKP
jgi:hypothetical protein